MEYNLVIPVYNRLAPLQRLIQSIEDSVGNARLNLIISLDGNASADVKNFAEQLIWTRGSLALMQQTSQLGVDQHNLKCMALTQDLGHIVLLEDDLYLSPNFSNYLDCVVPELLDDPELAGISLYRYPNVETYRLPFQLIPNGEFMYFQQRSSSKGCFYTKEMIEPYLEFNNQDGQIYADSHLPKNVCNWGDEVWEKSFYSYLQQKHKYLAFPAVSLSTDFGEPGIHMKAGIDQYVHQSALYLSNQFRVNKRETSLNVYDAFYELNQDVVKKVLPKLEAYDFEMDIYGTKDLAKIKTQYLISERTTTEAVLAWDRRLKPELNNFMLDQPGEFYSLALTSSFTDKQNKNKLKANFIYYYPDTKLIDLLTMKWEEVKSRFI